MERQIFSPKEGAELGRLCAEHEKSVKRTAAILEKFGMDSSEFSEADKADTARYRRIREMSGTSGKNWMA